jgi:hypothetical protein
MVCPSCAKPFATFLTPICHPRPIIGPICWPSRKPGQVLSDLQYPIDPEGLYFALQRCSQYGVPLYVTETGVSINSDSHREFTLNAYMAQVCVGAWQGQGPAINVHTHCEARHVSTAVC